MEEEKVSLEDVRKSLVYALVSNIPKEKIYQGRNIIDDFFTSLQRKTKLSSEIIYPMIEKSKEELEKTVFL
ncbi:MAG: hypothetical protein ACP5F8_02665 [Candidatus Aenigmatarchaeota archaeon]